MTNAEAVTAAVTRLGEWSAALCWSDVPAPAAHRLELVLLDSLGVTAVGAAEPEQQALVRAWDPQLGPCPLIGTATSTTVEAAAWCNTTALVRLELDEGHKLAAGHPAALGLHAVLALAASRGASGRDTLAALAVAYGVAARFGRATTLARGAHPHGSWGVAGAAAGCARLLGLDADGVAAAIDAGSGLPVAGAFTSALEGNPVRDAWMGAANLSGLAAARMAAAGQARNTGTAAGSLGGLLGALDPTELDANLGTRWEVEGGYLKRYAACSFTHPAVDAALALGVSGDDAVDVLVETHALAAALDRTEVDERLAALFSVPFVVAAALRHGRVDPAVSADHTRTDPAQLALMRRVRVVVAPDLDARRPAERPARVTVTLTDGTTRTAEVPGPVGDADHHPLDRAAVLALLTPLLGATAVGRLQQTCDALPTAPDVGPLLAGLATVPTREEYTCASTR